MEALLNKSTKVPDQIEAEDREQTNKGRRGH